jgi:hypothetical protein
MVLGALVVIAFIAQRFAQRNDELRRAALNFQSYAQGATAASSALAQILYWNASRPLMPAGRGSLAGQVRHDGTPYRTQAGAVISVQDYRGLHSINGGDRRSLLALLVQDGVEVSRAQAMIDVLDDYIDTDRLKRLNGAEYFEYQALGLAGPRNDWLVSISELSSMPLWRDDPVRLARLASNVSPDLGHLYNPLTAPIASLKAMFPKLAPSHFGRILQARSEEGISRLPQLSALVGQPLDDDAYILLPGNDSRIVVWAPGLPRAREYNVRLTPAGELGPWVITEQHSTKRLKTSDEAPRALAFPLAVSAQRPEVSVAP